MTEAQIELVRSTWAQVVPIADTAARLFYGRLFKSDPAIARLFAHTDMESQRSKLLHMLTVAVRSLDRPDTLRPALEALGRRHVGYGAEDRHYEAVGAALLWTLEQGLEEQFTVSVREAWTAAYSTLAGIMRTAAAEGIRAA